MKRLLLVSLLLISIGMTAQKFEIVQNINCKEVVKNGKKEYILISVDSAYTGTITIDRDLVIFDMNNIQTVFIKDGEYKVSLDSTIIQEKKAYSMDVECTYRRAITNEEVSISILYMDEFRPAFELDRTLWIGHGDVMEGYVLKQICQ